MPKVAQATVKIAIAALSSGTTAATNSRLHISIPVTRKVLRTTVGLPPRAIQRSPAQAGAGGEPPRHPDGNRAEHRRARLGEGALGLQVGRAPLLQSAH